MGLALVALAALLTPLPEVFGWRVYAVLSGSMAPTIPVGSIVAVRPVPAASLREGDVITFSDRSRSDVLITHRIMRIESRDGQRLAVTKGDANNTPDPSDVAIDRGAERVAFHVPLLGYLLVWLGSTTVKLAALAVAGAVLLLPSLRRRLGPPARGARTVPKTALPSAPSSSVPSPASAVLPSESPTTPAPPLEPAAPPAPVMPTVANDDEANEPSFDALAGEIDALLARLKADARSGPADGAGAARRGG